MKFTTESGSVYEINTDSKKIRRLNGKMDPTPRQGPDGQWRPYESITPDPIEVGTGVVIAWGFETELLPETKEFIQTAGFFAAPLTVTSNVVSIETESFPEEKDNQAN